MVVFIRLIKTMQYVHNTKALANGKGRCAWPNSPSYYIDIKVRLHLNSQPHRLTKTAPEVNWFHQHVVRWLFHRLRQTDWIDFRSSHLGLLFRIRAIAVYCC